MNDEARQGWDRRYAEGGMAPLGEQTPPPVFAQFEHLFPTGGFALDVACGRGRTAVWLASRGMNVWGIDISSVAIDLARSYAQLSGFAAQCHFDVHDLDDGLPPSTQFDLILCHLFREADIDRAMVERLKPSGMLAVACLSEVGHGPGPFRAPQGALGRAFGDLTHLEDGEAEGYAWLLARPVGSTPPDVR